MLSTWDLEDRELARRARAGSMTDFEILVTRYEERVYSFVMAQRRNRADAMEITQDTFVKAWQALDTWRDTLPFRTWVFTIARRKCIDLHRVASRRVEGEFEEAVDEVSPAEIAARREDSEVLWRTAQRLLSETQFQCVWLRYAEEMSVGEVSEVLGKGQTHVKVLLFRARLALAKHSGLAALAAVPAKAAPERSQTRQPGSAQAAIPMRSL